VIGLCNILCMFRKLARQFDWYLFIAVMLLSISGILVIYSTGISSDTSVFLAQRQLLFFGAGLLALTVISVINYDRFRGFSIVFYVLGIGALIAVLVFGTLVRGSRSWFDVGQFRIQPSEFMKIILILALAAYFARYSKEMYRIKHVIISGVLMIVPTALVLLQPDFGSAIILVGIWAGMVVMSGINKYHIGFIVFLFLVASVLGWTFFLEEYQQSRIVTFLHPEADPLDQGYNVIQSMIAVGSGGPIGRGLGHGSQSQLNFLPEQHTDFIFAVVAEELGFVGAFSLIFILFFVLYRTMRAGQESRNNFGFFLCIGVLMMFLSQIVINVGMNIGLMPVTGIPLPLLSYGGSSMVTSLIALGLVESVVVWRMKKQLIA
jgi:rod shape determining protein RodA